MKQEIYKVVDGIAATGDTIWWWSLNGPVQFQIKENCPPGDLENIRQYPSAYSIGKPECVILRGGEAVYGYKDTIYLWCDTSDAYVPLKLQDGKFVL